MKFIMIKCLIIFLVCFNVQSQEEKLILNFVSACKNQNTEIGAIKYNYICENKDNPEAKAALDKYIEERILSERDAI